MTLYVKLLFAFPPWLPDSAFARLVSQVALLCAAQAVGSIIFPPWSPSLPLRLSTSSFSFSLMESIVCKGKKASATTINDNFEPKLRSPIPHHHTSTQNDRGLSHFHISKPPTFNPTLKVHLTPTWSFTPLTIRLGSLVKAVGMTRSNSAWEVNNLAKWVDSVFTSPLFLTSTFPLCRGVKTRDIPPRRTNHLSFFPPSHSAFAVVYANQPLWPFLYFRERRCNRETKEFRGENRESVRSPNFKVRERGAGAEMA